MSDFHCLEIEFPNVDFNKFGYRHKKVEIGKIHHAHLYLKEDEIELRILFDDQTGFGNAFMAWISKINWRKFGSFLKIELTKNHTNERLQKVDLSGTKLIYCSNDDKYNEKGKKYLLIKIDTIKLYWDVNENEKNTAEFYLDNKGFRIVETFYSTLSPISWWKNDGKFEVGRMDDSTRHYKIGKSNFRPEFNFVIEDAKKGRIAKITKEPKIQFKYRKGITEKEAIFYGEIVLMLASFYHHIKIDYIFSRIHLAENTITIKKLEQKNFIETSGNLNVFGIFWKFNEFLEASWQKETLKNFELLSKVITLFNQSIIVDINSSYLIRYNIIEICDTLKQNNSKFSLALDKKQTKSKQDIAFKTLLETIIAEEHEEFKKRWNDIQAKLQNKPMKNQLVLFLESQNLNTQTFPIKPKMLKNLRDWLTHGSIDKVDPEELRKANFLLYRVCGILILNLMGIKEWKLITEIN